MTNQFVILEWGAREDLSEEMTFEQWSKWQGGRKDQNA